ncbi:MAG: COG4315 family predicted lipoprotein [Acidimicrobiales bacterium]
MRRARNALALVACLVVGGGLLAACDGGTSVTTVTGTPRTDPSVTIAIEPSPAGPVLATGRGRTLYDFAPDSPTHSACVTTICVQVWPPLIVTGRPTVGKGLHASLAGTVRRKDGTLQATYGGHPLYTWKGDTGSGVITGQALLNAGGYWYVIAPTGQQVTRAFTVLGKSGT